MIRRLDAREQWRRWAMREGCLWPPEYLAQPISLAQAGFKISYLRDNLEVHGPMIPAIRRWHRERAFGHYIIRAFLVANEQPGRGCLGMAVFGCAEDADVNACCYWDPDGRSCLVGRG